MFRRLLFLFLCLLSFSFLFFCTKRKVEHKEMERGVPSVQLEMEMEGKVMLTPESEEAIGVKLEKVDYRYLTKTIRTFGRIDFNEENLVYVTPRLGGRVDRILVNYVGYQVQKDEPLVYIYSPDYLSAEQEYIEAINNLEKAKTTSSAEAIKGATDLVEAAKRKLLLLGVKEYHIQDLEQSRQPQPLLMIHSPVAGTVTEKNIISGKYVSESDNLYTIADLSEVWMYAEIYEKDLAGIKIGEVVKIISPAYPEETFEGKITYVGSIVSGETRTVRIRCTLPNKDLKLKPGMYVDVYLQIKNPQPQLAVPSSAVLMTGIRNIVFVSEGNGTYDKREVRIGEEEDGYFPVYSGLKAGEIVVTEGNFLIDSQSQLEKGMGGMPGMPGMEPKEKKAPIEEKKTEEKKMGKMEGM